MILTTVVSVLPTVINHYKTTVQAMGHHTLLGKKLKPVANTIFQVSLLSVIFSQALSAEVAERRTDCYLISG